MAAEGERFVILRAAALSILEGGPPGTACAKAQAKAQVIKTEYIQRFSGARVAGTAGMPRNNGENLPLEKP